MINSLSKVTTKAEAMREISKITGYPIPAVKWCFASYGKGTDWDQVVRDAANR